MKLQESGEMYLESIYLLKKENPNVRSVDVANYTGYSKPSVSRAMGLLKQAELISISQDGYISLNPEGEKIATRIFERHTILSNLFMQLGVSKDTALEDACKIEHVISDETFNAIKLHLKKYHL